MYVPYIYVNPHNNALHFNMQNQIIKKFSFCCKNRKIQNFTFKAFSQFGKRLFPGKACVRMSSSSAPTTQLDYLCRLKYNTPRNCFRKTSIICTIGPASRCPEMLEKLIGNGMNIVRLNFSHGTHDYHAETIENARKAIRQYSCKAGAPHTVAIALDTKGPEIRTGLIDGSNTEELMLSAGETIKVTTDKEYAEQCTKEMLYVDYENIVKIVKKNKRIYIDDGLISLLVKEVEGNTLVCKIENGGKLGSRKGVNLPGIKVDLPAVTKKDKSDLQFGVKHGVDMIFASFVRNADAIREIRSILGKKGENILIIPKIENHEGMENIDAIIEASDGIMVARGDLGIEIETDEVPLASKTIIARCNRAGKPVICATQMLESMTTKPRPSRAEASDVANAVFDGADCVMLSGETAKGKYPVECVKTMSNICRRVEAVLWYDRIQSDLLENFKAPKGSDKAVALSAFNHVEKHKAKAIIVVSDLPCIAQWLSMLRPKCPIVYSTISEETARQCVIFSGIIPIQLTEDEIGENSCDFDCYLRATLRRLFLINLLDPEKSPNVVIVNALCPKKITVEVMTIVCKKEDSKCKDFSN